MRSRSKSSSQNQSDHSAKLPTISDVANLAGVSPSTVSRVLNTPSSVAPTARDAVNRAVATLAYVRHGAARALSSRRTHLIGAVVPTLDNPIFARCLDAMEKQLKAAGFGLLLTTNGYDPDREMAGIQMLIERGAEGLMLVGAARRASVYDLLAANQVVHCLTWIAHAGPDHMCVGFDNHRAAERVAAYLCDIGHRRFGMIAGRTDDNDRAAARLAGVRGILPSCGASLAVSERAYTVSEGRDALRALVRGHPGITAIICGNDILALGAVAEAISLGLRVPQDISITGFDDLEIATCAVPPLTTVRVKADQIGSRAADCLIALIANAGTRGDVELEADLVVRGSTAPPKY